MSAIAMSLWLKGVTVCHCQVRRGLVIVTLIYIDQLASDSSTIILPLNLSDLSGQLTIWHRHPAYAQEPAGAKSHIRRNGRNQHVEILSQDIGKGWKGYPLLSYLLSYARLTDKLKRHVPDAETSLPFCGLCWSYSAR